MARAVRGSIRVFCRLRPLLAEERSVTSPSGGAEGSEDALRPTSATQLEVTGDSWNESHFCRPRFISLL